VTTEVATLPVHHRLCGFIVTTNEKFRIRREGEKAEKGKSKKKKTKHQKTGGKLCPSTHTRRITF
jgi:hypothetical protein